MQLQAGDIIKEVVGIAGNIENETQLLHALRGRLDTSSIKVLRKNQELVIVGGKPPMPSVLAQRGIFASGVLFAPITFRDADEIRARGFMVHYIEPSSIGESQEVEKSDLLLAINDEKVEDFDQLFKRLTEAQKKGGDLRLTFRRISDNNRTMFSYVQRSLPIRDLLVIGPHSGL